MYVLVRCVEDGCEMYVPLFWIKHYKKVVKVPSDRQFICFYSLDMEAKPNFNLSYSEGIKTSDRLYKVTILKIISGELSPNYTKFSHVHQSSFCLNCT